MSFAALAGPWLAFALVLALAGPPDDDPTVRWRASQHAVEALPEEMPPAARSAVEAVAEWASDHAYRLDLEETGRVLLVSPEGRPPERALRLVERTLGWFDHVLPPPRASRVRTYRRPSEERAAPVTADAGVVPEDPEDDAPWRVAGFGREEDDDRTRSAPVETRWGAADVAPDTRTAIFFVVRTERELAKLLRFLADRHPYLKEWTRTAREQQGFSLSLPLAGAYVQRAEGQEEWSPDHEVVNRLTQLLALRRFGTLPNWLQQGIAWNAEFAILGAVYCFPYRSEFVWATEHTGWEREVQNAFEGRTSEKDLLRPEEFVAWKRGKYVAAQAKLSWAVTHELLQFSDGVASAIAKTLADFRDVDDRVAVSEMSWRRDVGYTIPVADQAAMLELYLGEEVWADWTARFRAYASED